MFHNFLFFFHINHHFFFSSSLRPKRWDTNMCSTNTISHMYYVSIYSFLLSYSTLFPCFCLLAEEGNGRIWKNRGISVHKCSRTWGMLSSFSAPLFCYHVIDKISFKLISFMLLVLTWYHGFILDAWNWTKEGLNI